MVVGSLRSLALWVLCWRKLNEGRKRGDGSTSRSPNSCQLLRSPEEVSGPMATHPNQHPTPPNSSQHLKSHTPFKANVLTSKPSRNPRTGGQTAGSLPFVTNRPLSSAGGSDRNREVCEVRERRRSAEPRSRLPGFIKAIKPCKPIFDLMRLSERSGERSDRHSGRWWRTGVGRMAQRAKYPFS